MKTLKKYLPLFLIALLVFAGYESKIFRSKKKSKTKTITHTVTQTVPQYFYATSEKPFVVIIPSYNNEEICERNLRSVFSQKYKNYRVIYVDDCSKDDTFKMVSKVVEELGQSQRMTLVHNEKNLGALENLYRAIHSCRDEEIALILDGDDFLAHDWVLEKLNCYYSDPNVWLTYGSYLSYPQYTYGECSRVLPPQVMSEVSLRDYSKKHGMLTSHLRTFYSGLFKKVKLKDLVYRGNFFDSTYDGAMMFPMIEMCGRSHILFVNDVLYIYNRANPLNDDKVNFEKQQRCWRTILDMPPYQTINQLNFSLDEKEVFKADVMVFSYDRPLQLYAYLESFHHYVSNYEKVNVLYRCTREEYQRGYEEVMRAFPEVNFIRQGAEPKKDFKPLLMQYAFKKAGANYIIFAVDDIVVKDTIDLSQGIREMKKRDAYGFYYRLGKHVDYCYSLGMKQGIPFTIGFENNVHAWVFDEGRGDWKYPNTVDMTLYKKTEIQKDLEELEFVNPNTLEGSWAGRADLYKIGLCYDASKIVNIPLGLVNLSSNRNMNLYSAEELLTLFNQGLKIDIEPLHQIQNISAHIEYHPLFITR